MICDDHIIIARGKNSELKLFHTYFKIYIDSSATCSGKLALARDFDEAGQLE